MAFRESLSVAVTLFVSRFLLVSCSIRCLWLESGLVLD